MEHCDPEPEHNGSNVSLFPKLLRGTGRTGMQLYWWYSMDSL